MEYLIRQGITNGNLKYNDMKLKDGISVCMIIKNESSMLATCLESVKAADEIIIIDTGSEDNSVEIAKKYTGNVFTDYKWADDFSEARNKSIEKAKYSHILIIDADETLEKDGIKKLKRRLKHYDDLTLKLKVQTDIEQLWSPRIFKNGEGIHYLGAIHNRLSTNEGGQLDIQIRSKTSPAHEKDPDRTIRILSKELRKDPNNTRNQYYMARECLRFDDLAGAVYWFERRSVVIDWTNEQADALFLLGDCYSKLGRGEDAVNTWIKVILINPEFKAAYESLAKSFQGPNRNKWLELAKIAKNTNLLFLR